MNNIDKMRHDKLSFEISSKILKLTKHKKRICTYALVSENEQENDLFYYLCTQYGYILINDKIADFYDNRKTKLEDIRNKYDMIIFLDGERHCKKKDVKLSIIDTNTIKLTFQSDGLFTNEKCSFLALSLLNEIYERLPKEEVKNGIGYRVKSKYKYLIK